MPACANCGKDLSPLAVACPSCGHAGPGAQRSVLAVPVATGTYEPWAVASLACGIAGLSILPVIASVLAIVFGHVARGRLREEPAKQGSGFATAGIILGWVGVALALLAILVVWIFLGLILSAFS